MLYLLFWLACESGSNIKATNASPTIAITSHQDGDTVYSGIDIEFRGTASDPNDMSSELEVEWRAGDRVLCPFAIPDIGGESICSGALQEDEDSITVVVRDDENSTSTASVELTLMNSEAPQVVIREPMATGAYYQDILIAFEGEVQDAEDQPSSLVIEWESSVDGVLLLTPIPDSNGFFSDFTNLSVGEHGISLSVTDSSGKIATATTSITVKEANTTPSCSITAPLTGAAGGFGDLVVFTASVSDDDIPSHELSVEWSSDKDGSLGFSTPNSSGGVTFPYADLTIDTHVVSMIVTDEVGASCVTDIVYTVGGPPQIMLLSPINGDLYNDGSGIVFSATIEDEEDSASVLDVSWSSDQDGVFSTQGPNPSGSIQFTDNSLSVGAHIITVSATDSDGLYAEASVSISVNGLPTSPSVSITPDPATTSDDLIVNATGSVDPEGTSVTYSYAWFVDGATTGMTSASLPFANTAKGEEWSVHVTPSDGMGQGLYAQASITISNQAPEITTVMITPSTPSTQDTLSCSYVANDVDGDPVSVAYAWYEGNNLLSSTTLTLEGPFLSGDTLTCRLTPSDGEDVGSFVEASVVISNTAPAISSLSIGPTSLYTNDIATATISANDADGDSLTYTWDWYVDSGTGPSQVQSQTSTGTSNTLDGVYHFDRDDEIIVEVTVDDGSAATIQQANPIVIQNTPPTAFNELISPTEPVAGIDDLVCIVQTSDADGDGVSVQYEWYKDGVLTTNTSDTVLSVDTSSGDSWECIITPNDGTDDGLSVQVSVIVDAKAEGAGAFQGAPF
ncbi:MAG: hypothetical protein CL916_06205, partial [Deltaproteobacteria bacterium]|nr:hypothetical protein [Deltaproteobacteria bacterium]